MCVCVCIYVRGMMPEHVQVHRAGYYLRDSGERRWDGMESVSLCKHWSKKQKQKNHHNIKCASGEKENKNKIENFHGCLKRALLVEKKTIEKNRQKGCVRVGFDQHAD